MITISFRSTYRLAAYYDVRLPGAPPREMKLQYGLPDYERGGWNYTREEFDRQVAASVGILHWHLASNDSIPPEVFETFVRAYGSNYRDVELSRGRYEPGTGWQRDS